MRKTFFIAGTDTDAGKTLVATGLLKAAANRGLATLGLKPVAAGCHQTGEGLRNEDANQLIEASTIKLVYEQVNPVAFEPPVAPHIAAAEAGSRLSVSRLAGYCRGALMSGGEFNLVEGAGGWLVPLNERENLSDLARELQLPVILVVGMKLGCINHALLTVQSLRMSGVMLAGWVANTIAPDMLRFEENIQTLKQRIPAPLLGVVPHLESPSADSAAPHLDIEPLLG